MKKLLTILTLLVAAVSQGFAEEKQVWEGSEAISWNTEVAPGSQFETPDGTFTGLKKDDIIRVYTTTTYDNPQYVLTYKKGDSWEWTDLETSVSEGVISYTVADETIATEIAERGLVIRGQAYTITKITVETPSSGDPEPQTYDGTLIYDGDAVVMGTDWSQYIQLAADKFTDLNPGAVIRVYIKDVAESDAQAVFQNGSWQDIEGVDGINLASTDTYYELTLTSSVLAVAKSSGLIVKGKNFTASAVSIMSTGTPITQYTLTTSATNGSIEVSPTSTDGKYDEGTSVTLTATADSGYAFSKWQKDGNDLSDTSNPLALTIDADMSITAVFESTAIPAFSLDGFTVASSDADKVTYDASTHQMVTNDNSWKGVSLWIGDNSTYSGSMLVLKTDVASKLKVMVYYVGGTNDGGDAVLQDETATQDHVLSLDITQKIKSVIIQNQEAGTITFTNMALDPLYTVNITAEHGSVAIKADGNATTATSFAYGTVLELTATAEEGYSFTGWNIGPDGTSTDNPLTYTVTSDIAFAAGFTEAAGITALTEGETRTLFEDATGTAMSWNEICTDQKTSAWGGILESGEKIIVTVASKTDAEWPKVILRKANSDEATNVLLNDISGFPYSVTFTLDAELVSALVDGFCISGDGVTITKVVLNKPVAVTQYTLTTSATNGSIEVSPTSTDGKYDAGTSVTLTATANSGYEFSKWQKDGNDLSDTSNPLTLTIDADMSITAVFTSTTPSDPNILWEGSQVINWNEGQSQSISVPSTTTLNVADCLVFTLTPSVSGVDWPQLQMSSLNGWGVLIGSANTAIDASTTEVRYYVTKAMLDDIRANSGFGVSGIGFTLSKVKIERGNGGEGYENAIWIGEQTYPDNWSVYTTIGKDLFANATAGQIIRIKFKDVETGANMSFSYNDDGWKNLPDAASITPSGLATKLTITDDMLTALKAGGLIISGVNFTLTSVDLLDASSQKALTGSVPVTGDDWVWTSSETPTFTLKVENGNNEAVAADAVLMIKTDKLADVTTLTESKEIAANGSGDITFTYKPTTAGFYHATIILNDETVRAFYFGYAPTEIASPADKQSDFDSFWQTAKTQLAAVEASDEPVLTEITSKSTSKRKVYLVEFKSVADGTSGNPVTVRGYYCEPTDGQKHPVIMHYLGYDSEYRPAGQDGAPYCPSGDDNPDYAEFYLSTRGQSVNNRKASERNDGIEKDFTNIYGDWFAYNFGKKDSWYYRGAYMDCVRAIDFMASRSTSDMENLFAEGQSQGGALTYAAAALSGRTFKAIAPAITFMGDFPDYFELTNWPANVAKENQGTMTDAEMYAFLSYFDTKNLATKVSCPVITSIGVQDNVCPPHTNIAPYNNVTTASADKLIVFNAELQHATNGEWYSVYNEFFDKYNSWENPNAKTLTVEEKRTLWTGSENLGTSWPAVASQAATVGGILEEGEKFLITVSAVAEDATDIQVAIRSVDYEHTLGFSKFDDFSSYPAEVKLILSAADVEAFKNGFHITGKNCTITKVVLYKPTPVNRTERTLVEKKQAIGDGIEINRGLFSNAAEEDVLKVYFEVAGDVTAKINLEDMDYNGIENSWPVITTSPYAYTFSAAALKKIQDSGLRIRGENFTFTKATLYTEKALGEEIKDDDEKKDDEKKDDTQDTIFDKEGEADLSEMTAQDSKTTVTYNAEDESITIKTTEDYKAAQIWFNNPETVIGNVLEVDIAESGVSVTVTVQYTDGSQSQMSSTASASARAMTRAAAGTVIKVPVETGKKVQNIEVKNAKAGTITIMKMAMITENVFGSDGKANLSMVKPQSNATYDVTTHTLATTQGWTGATVSPLSSENVSGEELLVRFVTPAQVKVAVKYRTNVDGPSVIMDKPANNVRLTLDKTKQVQEIMIQPTTASILTFSEIAVNGSATKDEVEQIFTNGKADLSKFVPQDENKVIYDAENHIIKATEGWTGVELNLGEGQEVSGKELKISFGSVTKVKVAVTYTDGKSTTLIMDDPDEVLRMEIDGSKKIQKIEIQPTEASNVTLKEVAVNKEPEDLSLKEGETRDLWVSGSGVTLNWNETAQQRKSVGSLLQEFDEILITVSGVAADNEWPKVFLRDAQSNQVGKEVLLNEVETFPYIVRIRLNAEMAEQVQRGFSICGDGVTVTKLQVYHPYTPKKGDIHLKALDYGYSSSYDARSYTVTTSARWAARGWEIGDMRYNSKDLVIISFEPVDFPVTIKMEYVDGNGEKQATSTGVAPGNTDVQMAIPEGIKQLDKVYLIFQNPGSLTLTDAVVVTKSEASSRGFINDGISGTTSLHGVNSETENRDEYYDLQGRRVEMPGKGLYIRNGKKIIVK